MKLNCQCAEILFSTKHLMLVSARETTSIMEKIHVHECKVCSRTFQSSRGLSQHKRLAYGLQEKKQSGMSCIHCGERFEWKRNCYVHMYYCDQALHNM